MKKEYNTFHKSIVVALNCFLGSNFILIIFYILGSMHFIGLFKSGGDSLIDILGLCMSIYNTWWLSSVVDIRKSFRKYTVTILQNEQRITLRHKKFLADVIYTLYWKEVYSNLFENETQRDQKIVNLINKSIDDYNQGNLL